MKIKDLKKFINSSDYTHFLIEQDGKYYYTQYKPGEYIGDCGDLEVKSINPYYDFIKRIGYIFIELEKRVSVSEQYRYTGIIY